MIKSMLKTQKSSLFTEYTQIQIYRTDAKKSWKIGRFFLKIMRKKEFNF